MSLRMVTVAILFAALASCSSAQNDPKQAKEKTVPEKKKEKLVFEETFDKGLANWKPEGPYAVEVKDGRMYVKTLQEDRRNGQFIWCRKELPDDFRLEWDVTPLSKSGFFLVFFCQKGVKGEDILGEELFEKYMNWKTWKPYHDWDKYTSPRKRLRYHKSRIRGYHISYRRNENANCNCRKNPGLVLVRSNKIDVLLPKDKTAHAVLIKQGGRIVLKVNDKLFMDYTDPKDPWKGGRFGFRNVYDADAYYDNVKLFDLTKEAGK